MQLKNTSAEALHTKMQEHCISSFRVPEGYLWVYTLSNVLLQNSRSKKNNEFSLEISGR